MATTSNLQRLRNRAVHDEQMRVGQLRRKFGLTPADYDRMVEEHSGVCAICLRPCKTGRRLAIDHCHETGTIRGLLCQNCNLGIGNFQDNPDLLRAAIAYLLRSKSTDGSLAVIHSDEKEREIPSTSAPPV